MKNSYSKHLNRLVSKHWTKTNQNYLSSNSNTPIPFSSQSYSLIFNSKSTKVSSPFFPTNSFQSFLYSSTSTSKPTSTPNSNLSNQVSSGRVFDNLNSSSILFVDPTSGIPIVFRKEKLETFPMNSEKEASEEVIYHNLKFLVNNSILEESDLVIRLCELWISNFGDPEDEQHSMVLLGQYLRKCGIKNKNIDQIMKQVNSFGSHYSNSFKTNHSLFNRGNEEVEHQDEVNIDRLLTTHKAFPYIQLEEE